MSCSHEHDDAAYVLGALSPADRVAFEQHLPDCSACSRAVSELAGIPGLLARAEPERQPDTRVPDTMLPALVRRVRTRQRQRRWTAGLGVAAAAAVVIAGLTITLDRSSPHESTTSVSAPAVAMHSLNGSEPVTARLSLTSVGWGTRLELTCDERAERSGTGASAKATHPEASYAMYVHTSDGRVQQVATWQSVPGGVVHVSGATATDRGQITDVDVRNGTGVTVLDLK